MVVYQEVWATVAYDAAVPCIELQWHAYAESVQFRAAVRAALAVYRARAPEHPVLHWLANSRHMAQVTNEDLEWANDVTSQELGELGLKFTAFVVPDRLMSPARAAAHVSSGSRPMTSRRFATVPEAKAWLTVCAAA